MTIKEPQDLVKHDKWVGISGLVDDVPFILRYREPILEPPFVKSFPRCLRIVWAYDDEESGTLPTPEISQDMDTFENRIVDAWEKEPTAVLTAVLTFDGARQWVFYTSNVDKCGELLNLMPQNDEPYPIELDVFDDDCWEYLRNEIIADRK